MPNQQVVSLLWFLLVKTTKKLVFSVGEIALDGIEDLIEEIIHEEEELSNEIDEEFGRIECAFYKKFRNEINGCEITEWGYILSYVMNSLIIGIIIGILSYIFRKICCKSEPKMIVPIQ